jgi:hypothetical protein
MRFKYKLNISIFTGFTAALVLLATNVYAGHHGKKQSDIVDTAVSVGTVEMLLLPENKDKLVTILTYHVVPGKVTASEVITMQSAPTANGSDLKISIVDETVFINDSRIVATDIEASNGIIHVVDSVILPN